MSAQFTFKGRDRWGVAHTGSQTVDLRAFVESRYETHWQSLDVRDVDGEQIGWIGRQDDGRLTWWVCEPADPSP